MLAILYARFESILLKLGILPEFSLIRNALFLIQQGPANLFTMLYSYATITSRNGGIPKGGSKLLVENMKNYFLELGGTLKLNTSVTEIIVENKKAIGVKTKKGDEFFGDYVVSTVSPEIVLNNFLNNKYKLPSFTNRLKKNNPILSCCLLQYDVEDCPDLDTRFVFPTETFEVGTRSFSNIGIRNYAYDKETFVKDNKTIVSIIFDQFDDDYYYWENLYNNDKDAYYKMKDKILNDVKDKIIKRFPELENKITPLDMATPHTFKRYVNTTRGAYMPFIFTPKNSMYHVEKIRGVKNLYLSGQWTFTPGGVPIALMTGQHIIQRICRKERIKCLSLKLGKIKNV